MNADNMFQPIQSATGLIRPVPLPPLSTPRPSLPFSTFANIIDGHWEVPTEAPRVRIDERAIRHKLHLAREFDCIPDAHFVMLQAARAEEREKLLSLRNSSSDPAIARYVEAVVGHTRPWPPVTEPCCFPQPPVKMAAQVNHAYTGNHASVLVQQPRKDAARKRLNWGQGVTAMDLLRAIEEDPSMFMPRPAKTVVSAPKADYVDSGVDIKAILLQILTSPPKKPEPGIPIHRGRFSSYHNVGARDRYYHTPRYAGVAAC
ncbi:hypothetical protein OBBRIDRAFT_792700 [Obba rivulosa]|uniref:Uncharacterized protein n=1 Tax=Obba rivulosa TaxID=1052685 RepID=A0A8E2AXR6_9APHY|nr:hypothetical protein OBBRIDRAFT_792700 [Obba rivulosa]